jgi:branched-chain amino acid transport system ATP-binding protein
MTLLEIAGLSAGYEDHVVVHDLGFVVEEAGFVLVIGANGSGKSTLLNALVGLARVFWVAKALYRGQAVELPIMGETGRVVSMVPQGHGVFDTLSVRENLELACERNTAGSLAKLRALANELLDDARVRLEAPAALLSGGQRQTLAILLGVVRGPECLLLDEPLAGLDSGGVERVTGLLRTVRQELAPAMLVVEHRYSSLLPMCNRVVAVRNGCLADLIEAPAELDRAVLDRRIDEAFFG